MGIIKIGRNDFHAVSTFTSRCGRHKQKAAPTQSRLNLTNHHYKEPVPTLGRFQKL